MNQPNTFPFSTKQATQTITNNNFFIENIKNLRQYQSLLHHEQQQQVKEEAQYDHATDEEPLPLSSSTGNNTDHHGGIAFANFLTNQEQEILSSIFQDNNEKHNDGNDDTTKNNDQDGNFSNLIQLNNCNIHDSPTSSVDMTSSNHDHGTAAAAIFHFHAEDMIVEPTPIGPPSMINIVSSFPVIPPHYSNYDENMITEEEEHNNNDCKNHTKNCYSNKTTIGEGNSEISKMMMTTEQEAPPCSQTGAIINNNNNNNKKPAPFLTTKKSTKKISFTSSTSSNKNNKQDQTKNHGKIIIADCLWLKRYMQLCEFKKLHNHCLVPYAFQPNPTLGEWVKRQRYQLKVRKSGKETSLTTERIEMLDKIGFVWSSHSASWDEKIEELQEFQRLHNHCRVPSIYKKNQKLANWLKRQKRQRKLYLAGEPSTMTKSRMEELAEFDF